MMYYYLQQDDLVGLGRWVVVSFWWSASFSLVLAMACGSLQSVMRENLSNSIQIVNQYYSPDMKNLVMYVDDGEIGWMFAGIFWGFRNKHQHDIAA
jgi:hypothetical protein